MTDKIQKFINSLEQKQKEKLIKKIKTLIAFPNKETDTKKLKGQENTYRLRMGQIRIIYIKEKEDIKIIDINYRGNLY